MESEYTAVSIVSSHIKKHHPKIIHRWDIGADVKLSMGQAKRSKMIQGDTGYPDLFVAEARGVYHGLYIEMKKSYSDVYKVNGDYKAGDHLLKQIIMRKRLQQRGYRVEWGLGAEDAIEKLNKYLSLDI